MLEPLGHRVLVKVTLEKKTAGGLVLVHDERFAKAAMEVGTIVGIGPNAWKAFDGGAPWAAIGDKVVFSKYGGKIVEDPTDAPEDGAFYMVLNDEDVLCKVPN